MLTAMITALNERRREMAILRALGAHPRVVFGLLVMEAALLTVCGILLGLGLLYAGLAVGASYAQAHYGLHIALDFPGARELALLGAIGAGGVLAGCVPAWLAYRRALADGLTLRF
jgi:putative ABC transport system permease protein